jgi:hypothetical protein
MIDKANINEFNEIKKYKILAQIEKDKHSK